jgi:thiamine kinase-like enzyme
VRWAVRGRMRRVEEVADRHVPGIGKIEMQRLGRGLVNDTYRVMREGNAYALRAAVEHDQDLGLDRRWEARVLECAVAAELAPALVYCDPERRILISRWVEGRSWSSTEVLLSANLSRMAALLHRIHDLVPPLPTRVMTPAQWVDYYSTVPAPTARTVALRCMASDRLSALAALPSVRPVLCHSDLHTLNLLDRGGSLVLLDWEYAHAADPFWDLASWSANNDFNAAAAVELLANYLGRAPAPAERSRLRSLGWLYDYVCLLWSERYLSLHPGRAGEVRSRAQVLTARLHLPE